MDISNTADVIDLRDVIERYEELEESRSTLDADDLAECLTLAKLLDECKGNGGDEQWRGDWYPVTLVRDSYFKEYAQELAEDIGAINHEIGWPHTCIDWEHAARELKYDYTGIDYDGVTYWVR